MEINFKELGLDRYEVLCALYDASKPLGMGRQLIPVYLSTITIFRHFLYKIFLKPPLILYKNKCRLL